MTFEATKHVLFSAVLSVANQQGWSIVKIKRSQGIVETLTPLDEYGLRNRWTFKVESNSITLARRIEQQTDTEPTDQWYLKEIVCVGYGYAREMILLAEIRAELSPPSPVVAAVAPPI